MPNFITINAYNWLHFKRCEVIIGNKTFDDGVMLYDESTDQMIFYETWEQFLDDYPEALAYKR